MRIETQNLGKVQALGALPAVAPLPYSEIWRFETRLKPLLPMCAASAFRLPPPCATTAGPPQDRHPRHRWYSPVLTRAAHLRGADGRDLLAGVAAPYSWLVGLSEESWLHTLKGSRIPGWPKSPTLTNNSVVKSDNEIFIGPQNFKFHSWVKKCHFGNISVRAGMAVPS